MATTELSKDEEAAFAAMAAGEAIAAAAAPDPGLGPDEEPVGDEPDGEGEGQAASSGKPPAKMVPHAALHEERTRRQGLEAENRKLAEERALFEGRLQAILGMQPQHPSQRVAEPDENTDPIRAAHHH